MSGARSSGAAVTPSTTTWRNWSGSLRFQPGCVARPESEEEVAALVRRAASEGQAVRVVGSGHSSSPLVETTGPLVSLERLTGIVSLDPAAREATLWAGTTLERAAPVLLDADLAFPNLGDVATQTIAGAIGTGTHGTGRSLPVLSAMLVGVRLVTGEGEAIERAAARDSEFLQAARVSLGVLGIFTQVCLRLVPAYVLQRQEWCTTVDACLAQLDELIATNRHVDFYLYPRSDEVKVRLLNPPGGGSRRLAGARLVEDRTGLAHQIIPKHSHLPYTFDEMEYALPAGAGPACFLEVRRRVRERHRRTVGWRVLYRVVAPDDSHLSIAHGRETVTISIHQNSSLPYWDYFKDIEPIFLAHGGRPHWGKKHTLRADDLRPRYPAWERFHEVRARVDPAGVFLTPYLRDLLGVER